MSGFVSNSLSPSIDQIHIPELMPQVAMPDGFLVSRLQAGGVDEGAEEIQVTGMRLVQITNLAGSPSPQENPQRECRAKEPADP